MVRKPLTHFSCRFFPPQVLRNTVTSLQPRLLVQQAVGYRAITGSILSSFLVPPRSAVFSAPPTHPPADVGLSSSLFVLRRIPVKLLCPPVTTV